MNVLNPSKYIDCGCGYFMFKTSISMELWDCGHMQRKALKLQCGLFFWIFVHEGVILFGMLPTLSPILTFAIRVDPKVILFCRAKGLGFDSKICRC
jgi:hypothetical protein